MTSLLALRRCVEKALWDAGDMVDADRAVHQLFDRAEAYEKALSEALEYRRVGRMPQDVLERLRRVLDA